MAKKIIKVQDTKDSKSSLDLGKITKTLMENGDAIGKIAEGVTELINSSDSKKTDTKKATSKKKTTKKSDKSLSSVFDIAETIFKNK